MEFIWIIFGAIILYVLISALVKAPGKLHQRKFISRGKLAGKTKKEIIVTAGLPNATSALPGGKSLLQWMATGYHISLIFNGEICEGVHHEFASK